LIEPGYAGAVFGRIERPGAGAERQADENVCSGE
jgi:hypothetical protein